MGCRSKNSALTTMIIMAISSLMLVSTACAQSIPKPSVPEFTVKFIPASYTVITTNPYTGTSVTQQYDNSTIEISITNQQYSYSNGSSFYVYLNIRTNGHFEENWTELYPIVGLLPDSEAYQHSNYKDYFSWYVALTAERSRNDYSGLPQSDSTYTTIILPNNYPSGGIVEFQVEAMIGHKSTFYDPSFDFGYDPASGGVNRPAVAYDTSSGWSNTKTITIPETASTSPTPTATATSTPTSTPNTPFSENSLIIAIALVVIVFSLTVNVILLVYLRKMRKRLP